MLYCVFRRERKLARQASFDKTILEDPVATACFNLDGTVRLWNPAAERLFGFSAAEALGHRPPTIPIAEFPRALEILKVIERGETIEAMEIRRQRKDGSAIELLLYESPLRDTAGEITGSLSHYIDISDRQQIAAALQQSVDDLEQRGREMTLLAELGELLDSSQTLDEAHMVIGRMAESLFPGDAGALYELEPTRNTAEAVAVWGDPPPIQRVMAPTECWALRRGRMHIVRPDEEPFCPHIAEPIRVGAICEPLAAQSETLGVFHLQVRKPRGPAVLVERERVTQTLGEHLALALANFRLRDIMREQSSRDPLTDLYNRRFMEETRYRELRRAAREDGSVGVLMIDLDRFNALNDAFGHATGDVALRTIADYLKAGIRGGDVACRYGGEEFVVILPKASLADAVQRAEALRDGLRSLGDPSGEGVPSITISVGVAAFPDHGQSSDEVLVAADRALYRAKAEGRNRVAVADDREAQRIESTGA
jgi:diguanylate cyclase (GGDEF)-like protein/PAS domain S-box-containing protein